MSNEKYGLLYKMRILLTLLALLSTSFADVSIVQPNPVIVNVDDSFSFTCVSDSPWIWMDFLKNDTLENGASSRFLRPINMIVRWEELVTSDPTIALQKTQLSSNQTAWTIIKTNVLSSDEGYYSCVEQIHAPQVNRLTEESVKYLRLIVV